MAYKVWLDAGHGGKHSGAIWGSLIEKAMTLVTTLECQRELERHGVTVGMTRTGDTTHELADRCEMANNWGADYFISIHYNAGGGDGAESIHSIFYGKGTELAKKIVARIDTETDQNLRPKAVYSKKSTTGNKDYYQVIRSTKMTAVIVEGAFIDSADREVVDTVAEQKKMGIAIAHGILDQLGIAVKPEIVAQPVKPKKYGIVTAKVALNVRKARGNYPIITTLPHGYKVELLQLQDGWWAIPVDRKLNPTGFGYVDAKYIQVL